MTSVGFPPYSPSHTSSQPSTPKRGGYRRRWTRQDTIKGATNTELALAQTRRWIEECTGCVQEERGFREYLQDGTLLCGLIQTVRPDLIRKIKRVKSPFAWRENLGFFLEACKSLGLKGSQLFSPDDLITPSNRSPSYSKAGIRGENERRLRNVAVTIFWLSRALQKLPDYAGPLLDLDLSAWEDFDHNERTTLSRNSSFGSETSSPYHHRKRSYTSPELLLQSKHSPSPPSPSSPYHASRRERTEYSPTIQVKRVESVVTVTDKQAYPQVIVCVGKKENQKQREKTNGVSDRRKTEPELPVPSTTTSTSPRASSSPPQVLSIFDQLTESEKALSNLTEELTLTEQELGQRHLSPPPQGNTLPTSPPHITTTTLTTTTLTSPSPPPENLSDEEEATLQELINAELQQNRHRTSSSDALLSRPDSCSTPSEVSTIIARDQALSRCSGASFSEETGGVSATQLECLETKSATDNPRIDHHPAATESTSCPGSECPPPQSPPPLDLNHRTTPEDLDQAFGTDIPLRGSPLLDIEAVLSSHLPKSDLTTDLQKEGGETLDDTSTSTSLSISAPSSLLESSPSPGDHSPTTPLASTSIRVSQLEQITEEESEQESEPQATQSSDSSFGQSETQFLHPLANPPIHHHPTVAALKEEYRKSFHSSASSLDSASCSVIEVSYHYPTPSETAESSAPTTSNYSSSSENESLDLPEPVSHYLVDLETAEPHSADEDRSAEVSGGEIESETAAEDMAVKTQIMRIYPAQSMGETSVGVAVPHHRVHLSSTTSVPESPRQRTSTARGSSTILYMMPTSVSGREMTVTVLLQPGEKHLGLSLATGTSEGGPCVETISEGTPASRSALQCGDELLAVGGQPLTSLTHSQILELLQKTLLRDGKLILKIRRPSDTLSPSTSSSSLPHHPTSTSSLSEVTSPRSPPGLQLTAQVADVLCEDEEEEEEEEVQPPCKKTSRASLPAMHVDVNPISRLKLGIAPQTKVGGGSVDRVRSDALPLTMHASKLTVPETVTVPSGEDHQSDLSDLNSMAVEVGSSLESLTSSKLSIAHSHRSVSSSALGSRELHAQFHHRDSSESHQKQKSDDSFITSVLAASHGRGEKEGAGPSTRGARPGSAPTRATSDSLIPLPPSTTTSSSSSPLADVPKLHRLRDRKVSVEDERQKRMANIAESTRAALTFSAMHKSKKSESLPRDQRFGSKSVGSEEELLGTSLQVKPLSPAATMSSPSSPFNLRNMSMDETRKASMNEMEEIWKLVESESGGSSTSLNASATGGGEVGAGVGSRGPPGIALESHFSPRHVFSEAADSRRQGEVEEKGAERKGREKKQSATSPVRNTGPRQVKKGKGKEEGKVGARQHSSALDRSEVEVFELEKPQMQSTPKRPGGEQQPRTPDVSMVTRGQRTASVTSKGIDSLLTTLRSMTEKSGHPGEGEGLKMLEDMLHSNTFKRAQEMHDRMHQMVSADPSAPKPVHRRVVPTAQEARHHFHHHTEPSPEVNELRALLRDPHVQALMFSHDRVSTRDFFIPKRNFPRSKQDPVDIILSGSVLNFQPTQPLDNSLPLSRDIPSTRKEDATIVYLQRSNRPLGCTIYKQGDAVFVGKLLKGCDAELSEVLREGDELLEVNGVPVMGRSTDEIVRLMSGEAGMTLAFTIIPIHDDNIDLNYEPKYVRAHFNYSPNNDDEIICKPLGLRFEKGDILEISNQDDPDWWQARKVFDDGAESLPGLVPARHRQQKREAITRSIPLAMAVDEQQQKKKGLMSKLSRKKKKTVYYTQGQQHGMLSVGDEVVTYEDVVRMEPHPQWRRPIVLIGASGVGKGTLIRKLINSDHTHFATVVQHTTRLIRPGEVHGHTYHFVTREEFEHDILHERFLEYQEVKGHYFGTSVSAVKKVIESGRVPVLDLQPQSLKKVRYSGLMPYVVFIASPRLERLFVTRRVGSERQKKRLGSTASPVDMDDSHMYTEPELHHLLVESRLVESQYSHYFDWIIVNDDLSVALDMLKEVARRAEEETHWVPASWMQDHSF